MKIFLLGSGAREHAITRALTQDPEVESLIVAPGNPGIAQEPRTTCLPEETDLTNGSRITELAAEWGTDLLVIGPEAPLVAGVADAAREAGIACMGPSAAAAQLEGSKAFAKEIMAQSAVPTARAQVCSILDQLRDALDATAAPYVVKDDGLASGKGVVVTDSYDEALAHGEQCLGRPGSNDTAQDSSAPTSNHSSGTAQPQVVVEEFLDGPEVSLFCLTDGQSVLPLSPAQDFKRALDADAGPNTGGMGAYSPLPWAGPDLVDLVVQRVAMPTITEMAKRGTPFVGVLYVGLALTSRGPRVIEFNARFGDPETQAVLARLQTPLSRVLHAVATQSLHQVQLSWRPESAVTLVLAAPGYPSKPHTGGLITGLDEAASVPGVHLLHAGTDRGPDGELVASGGRVLSVVALGQDLAQARQRAYEAMGCLHLDGGHWRTDIGAAAAAGEVTVPAADLNGGVVAS